MKTTNEGLGIDWGGTNIRVARITQDGKVLDYLSHKVPSGRSAQIGILDECIKKMLTPDIIGIGIGFPGVVRISDGYVLTAGFLELEDFPLGERVRSTTGLPVIVDNDAYMATFAEMKIGAAVGRKNIVTFTIGTGIGGAIALGGKLFHGRRMAGQVGHITIREGGKLCKCGRRGCLETLSSGTALQGLINDYSLPPETNIEDLFRMEKAGNEQARKLLTTWISPLKMGIDSMVAVFSPDIVLLGGGLGKAAFHALNCGFCKEQSPWFDCPLDVCSLGDTAGVIGAGLRVFEEINHEHISE